MVHRSLLLIALVAACGEIAPADQDPDSSSGGDAADAADAADATDASARGFAESFGSGDASAWPSGWRPLGGVASATVEGGRARLVPTPSNYTLGRMGHATFAGSADVEATFGFEMRDVIHQGVGFYVRQNGGYLTRTSPTGAGYAVFVEGFAGNHIGLWRERDGTEEALARTALPSLAGGVRYTVRFRVTQQGASTRLQAKLWRAADAEPAGWMVEHSDSTPALQNLEGGIAVDAWNTVITGGSPSPAPIYVDDIVVEPAD